MNMNTELISDTVQYGRTTIEYKFAFSRRKHLSISVYPDLSIIVFAPATASLEKIREKIKKRGGWILKQVRFFNQFLPVTSPRQFVSGESHLYLGKQYRLKIREGEENRVKLQAGYFQVMLTEKKTIENVKKLMSQWYNSHADAIYSNLIEQSLKKLKKFNLEKPAFRIRQYKRRWGNCSKSGVLTLNKDLIKTPKSCIEYVITHELCHLIEQNHSPKFYALLDKNLPDWKTRKEQLNLFGNAIF